MSIIVTEMPEYPCQCPLSKMKSGDYICSKYDTECNIDMCDLLTPIGAHYREQLSKLMNKRTD